MAAGSVDILPLNGIFAILATSGLKWSCPLRVEESPDSVLVVAGIGTADTSEIIRAKTSVTRPARE